MPLVSMLYKQPQTIGGVLWELKHIHTQMVSIFIANLLNIGAQENKFIQKQLNASDFVSGKNNLAG